MLVCEELTLAEDSPRMTAVIINILMYMALVFLLTMDTIPGVVTKPKPWCSCLPWTPFQVLGHSPSLGVLAYHWHHSRCWDTAQALVFLLVSMCCDTAQALVFWLVSMCCDSPNLGVLAGVNVF